MLTLIKKIFSPAKSAPEPTVQTSAPTGPEVLAKADVLFSDGRLLQAKDLYEQALKLDPNFARAHSRLGYLYLEEKNGLRAHYHLEKALHLDPANADVHYMFASILFDRGEIEESITGYRRAIELDPSLILAYRDLGMAYILLNQLQEANAIIDKALELFPDFCDFHYYKGNLHSLALDYASATACFSRALSLEKNSLMLYTDLASALLEQNKVEEAIKTYQLAQVQFPDFPDIRFSEGICQLLLGDFKNGFRNTEWRFKMAQIDDFAASLPQPARWNGTQDLAGKTLILITEQGFGDTIQYLRYIPLLKARKCQLILVASAAIKPMLEKVEGVDGVCLFGDEVVYDYFAAMMSLPLLLGTTFENIPAQVPYIKSEASRTAAWRQRLARQSGRPLIGIAWSGNPAHKKDRTRSINLNLVRRLFDVDADFIVLQKDVIESDQAVLRDYPNVRHFGADMHDFLDTAAIVDAVDLVITVDTSIVHLSGAMAKPTWVMVEFSPDWRWFLGRDDSPWYPTARVWRQPKIRDWDGVIDNVGQALLKWKAEQSS